MKLSAQKAKAFLVKPDPHITAILLFGADAMRVSLKRQALIEALVGKNAEAEMRLERFEGSELRKDPARLIDGLKSVGFFAGKRVVFVEGASDGLADTFSAAFEDWQEGDASLVVTAGSLNARSKLRKAFEAHNRAVAIGIYDDPPTRDEVISALQKAGAEGLAKEAIDAMVALSANLDPGEFAQLTQKLALYVEDQEPPIGIAAIEAVAPLSTDSHIDEVIHAVAEAKTHDVGPILKRLYGQGVEPVTLAIMANRHFQTLYYAASDPRGIEAALSSARPPVFGPRRDRMSRQARLWGASALARALATIYETDLSLRSSGQAPARAVLERAFLRIAMTRKK